MLASRGKDVAGIGKLDERGISSRVLLCFFAMALQLIASAISGVGFSLDDRWYWAAGFILWVMWFALMFFIAAPRTEGTLLNHRASVKRGATIIVVVLIMLGMVEMAAGFFIAPAFRNNNTGGDFAKLLEELQEGYRYNDGTALGQQAAENLLAGKNPYATANLITAMLKYEGSLDRVTPLRTGVFADVYPYPSESQLKQVTDRAKLNPGQPPPELESRVCYPAGCFLLPAPFIAIGITDVRIVFVLFVLAGLAYAIWRVPAKKRFVLIIFALVSLELWNSLADGETGSILFPMLLIAWVGMDRNRWVTAIAMGLAVTTKQTAWFFLPFYLVAIWRKLGLKSLLFTTAVIATVFFVTNIYFIALDPVLWFESVLSPMTDPMFPFGVGLISVVTGFFENFRSPLFFLVLEGAALLGGVVWYARNYSRYPVAGLALAVLPLLFAWRSLWSYFFYVQIIVITLLLKDSEDKPILQTASTGGLSESQPAI